MEGFCQLLWRPRPASLLPEDKVKEIKRNLKKYSPQFEMKDRMAQSKVSEEILQKRRKLKNDFQEWRDRKEQEFKDSAALRSTLREGREELEAEGFEEETIEFFTKEEITPLSNEDQ